MPRATFAAALASHGLCFTIAASWKAPLSDWQAYGTTAALTKPPSKDGGWQARVLQVKVMV
jgi:hypothetical protein